MKDNKNISDALAAKLRFIGIEVIDDQEKFDRMIEVLKINSRFISKDFNGEIHGFVENGVIYINPSSAKADTPIHEYAHLWCEMLRKMPTAIRINQKWIDWRDDIVPALKRETSFWNKIKTDNPELSSDDDIAEEIIASYSGKLGAKDYREGSALQNIANVLEKFWLSFLAMLGLRPNRESNMRKFIADKILDDFEAGVNPVKEIKDINIVFESEKVRQLALNDINPNSNLPKVAHNRLMEVFENPQLCKALGESGALRPCAMNESGNMFFELDTTDCTKVDKVLWFDERFAETLDDNEKKALVENAYKAKLLADFRFYKEIHNGKENWNNDIIRRTVKSNYYRCSSEMKEISDKILSIQENIGYFDNTEEEKEAYLKIERLERELSEKFKAYVGISDLDNKAQLATRANEINPSLSEYNKYRKVVIERINNALYNIPKSAYIEYHDKVYEDITLDGPRFNKSPDTDKEDSFDFKQYLNMHERSAGSILEEILAKKGIKQYELYNISSVKYQFISDFIQGKRNISIDNSFLFEQALGIDIPGFFYQCQSNNVIYKKLQERNFLYAENNETQSLDDTLIEVEPGLEISDVSFSESESRRVKDILKEYWKNKIPSDGKLPSNAISNLRIDNWKDAAFVAANIKARVNGEQVSPENFERLLKESRHVVEWAFKHSKLKELKVDNIFEGKKNDNERLTTMTSPYICNATMRNSDFDNGIDKIVAKFNRYIERSSIPEIMGRKPIDASSYKIGGRVSQLYRDSLSDIDEKSILQSDKEFTNAINAGIRTFPEASKLERKCIKSVYIFRTDDDNRYLFISVQPNKKFPPTQLQCIIPNKFNAQLRASNYSREICKDLAVYLMKDKIQEIINKTSEKKFIGKFAIPVEAMPYFENNYEFMKPEVSAAVAKFVEEKLPGCHSVNIPQDIEKAAYLSKKPAFGDGEQMCVDIYVYQTPEQQEMEKKLEEIYKSKDAFESKEIMEEDMNMNFNDEYEEKTTAGIDVDSDGEVELNESHEETKRNSLRR